MPPAILSSCRNFSCIPLSKTKTLDPEGNHHNDGELLNNSLPPEDDRSPRSTLLPEDPASTLCLIPELSLRPLVQTEPCTVLKTRKGRGSPRRMRCHLSTASLVISLHNIYGPMPRTSWRRKWIWTYPIFLCSPRSPHLLLLITTH